MWEKGPLPAGTWNWGGVVIVGDQPEDGFYFADFKGDHVVLSSGTRVDADKIAFYNNSLGLPPGWKSRK